jgi:hypothetical protein
MHNSISAQHLFRTVTGSIFFEPELSLLLLNSILDAFGCSSASSPRTMPPTTAKISSVIASSTIISSDEVFAQ